MAKLGLFQASTPIEKKLVALIDAERSGPAAWRRPSSPPLLIYKIILGSVLFLLISARLVGSAVSRAAWSIFVFGGKRPPG